MNAQDLLRHFEGNKTAAAKALEVTRTTIYNWDALPQLPDEAMRRMRDWFLKERGEVPKAWWPK